MQKYELTLIFNPPPPTVVCFCTLQWLIGYLKPSMISYTLVATSLVEPTTIIIMRLLPDLYILK